MSEDKERKARSERRTRVNTLILEMMNEIYTISRVARIALVTSLVFMTLTISSAVIWWVSIPMICR